LIGLKAGMLDAAVSGAGGSQRENTIWDKSGTSVSIAPRAMLIKIPCNVGDVVAGWLHRFTFEFAREAPSHLRHLSPEHIMSLDMSEEREGAQ